MTPLGSIEFSIEELPDELRIRYSRHAGWIERIVAPAAVPALMTIGWLRQQPVSIIGASVLFISLLVSWLAARERVLQVVADRLIASSYFSDEIEILRSNIEGIEWVGFGWFAEGRGPDGLYVRCAGRRTCIFPVTEEKARAVLNTISRRFPKYPIDIPGSHWWDSPQAPSRSLHK